jgi:hypothetical protein
MKLTGDHLGETEGCIPIDGEKAEETAENLSAAIINNGTAK